MTRGGDAGLVTLELALLMPTLLFLFAGALSVGHRIYVHHEVTHQARRAARACVVAGLTATDDVHACEDLSRQALADAQGTSWAESCGGQRATVTVDPPSPVGTLRVRISCSYLGIVPSGLLRPSEDVAIEQEVDIEALASLDFTADTTPPLLRHPDPIQFQPFSDDDGIPPPPGGVADSGENDGEGSGGGGGFRRTGSGWGEVDPDAPFYLAPTYGGLPIGS